MQLVIVTLLPLVLTGEHTASSQRMPVLTNQTTGAAFQSAGTGGAAVG